jgi:hypothetical protein
LHKLRSVLTSLGVLCGVASVIAMLAIAEGAARKSQDLYRALGSQNIILRSVKPTEDVVSGREDDARPELRAHRHGSPAGEHDVPRGAAARFPCDSCSRKSASARAR